MRTLCLTFACFAVASATFIKEGGYITSGREVGMGFLHEGYGKDYGIGYGHGYGAMGREYGHGFDWYGKEKLWETGKGNGYGTYNIGYGKGAADRKGFGGYGHGYGKGTGLGAVRMEHGKGFADYFGGKDREHIVLHRERKGHGGFDKGYGKSHFGGYGNEVSLHYGLERGKGAGVETNNLGFEYGHGHGKERVFGESFGFEKKHGGESIVTGYGGKYHRVEMGKGGQKYGKRGFEPEVLRIGYGKGGMENGYRKGYGGNGHGYGFETFYHGPSSMEYGGLLTGHGNYGRHDYGRIGYGKVKRRMY